MSGKSVLVFTLDANNVRICESSNENINKRNRREILNTKFKTCVTADFFPEKLLPSIKERNPSMLFFVTSNESSLQSYFHTDLLKNILVENGYSLLKHSSLNKSDITSINISLYVKSEDEQQYTDGRKLRYFISKETFAYRSYGALAIKFVAIDKNKRTSFCFVGVSLPDDSDEYEVTRAQKLIYLNSINNKVIKDSKGNGPDYLVMAGNFGYLLDSDKDISNLDVNQLLELDYITGEKTHKRSLFYGLKEGIDDRGPSFFPTFEARIGRNTTRCTSATNFAEYRSMCLNNTTDQLGWNSRILYKSEFFDITCDEYAAVDYGNTSRFNNLGIMATINFS